MRKYLLIAFILILCGSNFYFINKTNHYTKMERKLDGEFKVSLARISVGLVEGSPPQVFALEHAYQALALSKYTSYYRENSYIETYSSHLAFHLSEKVQRHEAVRNVDEISELLMQLSKDPEDHALAQQILSLIKSSGS